MANEVPQLFDPVKAELALARAKRRGIETFLLDRVLEDLGERLQPILRSFEDLLDCGLPEGVFSACLHRAGKLAPDGRVTILDGSKPLDLSPATQDCAIAGMLFHRINDLPGLMVQLRRVLKPDGLMLAVFPGGDTLHELRDSLMRAESEIAGHAVMRVAPMIDVRAGGQLLQRAGFALPVADSEKIVVRYSSLRRLISDLRAMGSTASLLKRAARTPLLTRAVFLRAAEIYAHDHADADGKLRASFEFVWLSGWAPHQSQQQPLKPGSAKTRLADALGAIQKAAEHSGGQ